VILKYSLAWIPMVFIAILNGIFRESVLAKTLSELRAHQRSCLRKFLDPTETEPGQPFKTVIRGKDSRKGWCKCWKS
jgi:hypothetical protein